MNEKTEEDPKIRRLSKRRERRKRQKLLLIELFLDYAKNSTLHGLRYVAERSLTIIEKTFWLLTFIISMVLCSLLIRNVYIKWKTSPVIVTISEQLVSVGKVPFPTITICPESKFSFEKYNYTETFLMNISDTSIDKIDPEVLEQFLAITTICGRETLSMVYADLVGIDDLSNANSSMIDFIMKVSSVEDHLRLCIWRGEHYSCNELFDKVLTREGVCYTFNALSASELFEKSIQKRYKYLHAETKSKNWSVESGYDEFDFDEDPYPRRGRDNGASPDLEITLSESRQDKMCNCLRKGFKIYVSNPADLPQSSLYYYAALPGQVSSVALKFTMLNTSKDLMNYSPEQRQCYFAGDYPLKYFKTYTSSNCLLECRTNKTFEKCGCVWFHMPFSDDRKICTVFQMDCMLNAMNELSTLELLAEFGKNVSDSACRCLPACYSVQYDAEILKTYFDLEKYFKTLKTVYKDIEDIQEFLNERLSYNYSKVELFFKEPRFISMRRSELFGVTDFLANIGGLLGLFLGFSFLSLVEIGYFATLRLFYTLKRDLKQEKSTKQATQ